MSQLGLAASSASAIRSERVSANSPISTGTTTASGRGEALPGWVGTKALAVLRVQAAASQAAKGMVTASHAVTRAFVSSRVRLSAVQRPHRIAPTIAGRTTLIRTS
jgi:hypothetical protein